MDKTISNWATIVTAIVAVITVIVSIITLILNRREKWRRVKVELSYGLLTYDGPHTSPAVLLISAMNSGDRSVTLNSLSIRLPNKKHVVFIAPESDVRFPHELKEGKNCTTWVDTKTLANSLKDEGYFGKITLTAFFKDAVGNIYKSNAVNFDIDDWGKAT